MRVLDGGLSTALAELGEDLSSELWTARLLADRPQSIVAAHRAFFDAGAEVATTASYQASVPGFVAAGMTERTARELIGRSVALARQAAAESGREGLLVAASVGPYGAYLADGSEYRGDYGIDAAELREFHAPRLELLARAEPDLLAVETIPDLREAEVLVELIGRLDVPAWLCYSISGAHTRAGQPLTEAFDLLAGARGLVAAGANCSELDDVVAAVPIAIARTGLAAVAYPNRGGAWDPTARRWSYGPPLDPDRWRGLAASDSSWIGGCCGVGPADIAALAARGS